MRKLACILILYGLLSGCNDKPDIDRNVSSPIVTFPNPATNAIYVHIDRRSNESVTLQIFDPAGTMFVTENFPAGTASIDILVSLNDKPKGFYEAVLINGKSITRQRFVKL